MCSSLGFIPHQLRKVIAGTLPVDTLREGTRSATGEVESKGDGKEPTEVQEGHADSAAGGMGTGKRAAPMEASEGNADNATRGMGVQDFADVAAWAGPWGVEILGLLGKHPMECTATEADALAVAEGEGGKIRGADSAARQVLRLLHKVHNSSIVLLRCLTALRAFETLSCSMYTTDSRNSKGNELLSGCSLSIASMAMTSDSKSGLVQFFFLFRKD